MNAVDNWLLVCAGRTATAWIEQDYTVLGLDPNPGQRWGDGTTLTLCNLGGGTVALQLGSHGAYASMRDDNRFRLQFQAPFSNGPWITNVGGDEIFQIVPTGDGFFALYSPSFGRYVQIDPAPDPVAGNCNPLHGVDDDMALAARFSAVGQSQAPVLSVLAVGRNAAGMSLAGVDLAGRNADLSHCDLRGVTGLATASLAGANLQGALLGNLKTAGLGLAGADCTGADFTGTDFTGFVPGTPPPTLTGATLTGAVVPSGAPWTGARLHGAVLGGADLTGADLAGASTDLSSAHLAGVTVLTPDHQGTGIAGYDLASPADRVLAYDHDGTGCLDHLVCYRPGRGAVVVARRQADGTYGHVYFQGDPGSGIGGCTLSDPADRIIAFDWGGTGRLDHLLCYRPGGGLATVLEKAVDGTFSAVFSSTGGIGDFPLTAPADRIIAFDWHGDGRLDHLLCCRPGAGLVTILQRTADGGFASVWSRTDGIGGWDLGRADDQVLAYDYDGTGQLDHVVCYRPGVGGVAVLERRGDDSFAPVYFQGEPGAGIGGFSLTDSADRIIAYDGAGTGRLDHLFCYRPSTGLVRILARTPGTSAFEAVYARNGIAGYALNSPADVAVAYDPLGAGRLDGLALCRPGPGTVWIAPAQDTGPATLTGCLLDGTDLTGADLSGADLRQPASLRGATLTGATLRGATLTGVDLTGANLAATDFTGCDLTTTTFSSPFDRSTDPDHPTIFAHCTLPYTLIGLDWSYLDLTGATIAGLPHDLTGLVARGARRPNGDFTGMVLDGADFTLATLDGALFTQAKLRARATFAEARLIGSEFTGAVLDQAVFTGATLGGVAQVQATKFSFAFLSNCDFTGANLYAVVFAGATLLGGNVLSGTQSLEEADFDGCYMAAADLSGANVKGATFDDAFMVQVVLTGADLTPSQQGSKPASLTSACMQAVEFTGVELGGADLANAVITDVRGLIQQQYYDANGDLTPMAPMRYPAGVFPAASSFTDATTCPNGLSYETNSGLDHTIAQMMAVRNPPTSWSPPGTRSHGNPHRTEDA